MVPEREDKRYRSWKEFPVPEAVACVVYMMDVSGSMTDEQKEIVRIESFWIDTWIKAHYKGVDRVYIIHDAAAHEGVDLVARAARALGRVVGEGQGREEQARGGEERDHGAAHGAAS